MDFMALLREERRKAGLCAGPAGGAAGSASPAAAAPRGASSLSDASVGAAADAAVDATVRDEGDIFPPFAHETLLGARERTLVRDGLEAFRVNVPTGLRDVWYIPDFCSQQEHDDMLAQTYARAAQWQDIRCRRLQCYRAPTLPPWLEVLASSLVSAGVFTEDVKPNHALLNEYKPGQGILGHTDGPVYHGLVACLSLGSSASFVFTERLSTHEIGTREPRTLATLLLRPRSLVVFAADAYVDALHSVPALDEEVVGPEVANLEAARARAGESFQRVTRVSITMRTELERPGA